MYQADPYSQEELEYRFQELRAQQDRAKQLFYCYASATEETEGAEVGLDEDAYYSYYADEHGP